MGWFDDAADKAKKAKEDAEAAAAERAAKAAMSAAAGAVSRTVGGFFEGIVSSAEGALAEAEEKAAARGITGQPPRTGADVDAAGAELEETLAEPVADPLGRKMREVAQGAPAPRSAPPPEAPRTSADPFAAAHAALERSRAARGATSDVPEPVRPSDPVAAALAAAAEARAHATSGGRRQQSREDSAREQLAAMKASLGARPPSSDPDEPTPAGPATKKRSL